jgi:hypothetical protein
MPTIGHSSLKTLDDLKDVSNVEKKAIEEPSAREMSTLAIPTDIALIIEGTTIEAITKEAAEKSTRLAMMKKNTSIATMKGIDTLVTTTTPPSLWKKHQDPRRVLTLVLQGVAVLLSKVKLPIVLNPQGPLALSLNRTWMRTSNLPSKAKRSASLG